MCNAKAYCEIKKIKNQKKRRKRGNLAIHLEAFEEFVHPVSLSTSFFLPNTYLC